MITISPSASLATITTSTRRMILFSTTFSISRAMLPSNLLPSKPMTMYSSGPSVMRVLLLACPAAGREQPALAWVSSERPDDLARITRVR